MTKRHISWFIEGRVVATVKSRAAVSDVPMTLRLSLAGRGLDEVNRTQAISDWQRGYSLERGRPEDQRRPAAAGHPRRRLLTHAATGVRSGDG